MEIQQSMTEMSLNVHIWYLSTDENGFCVIVNTNFTYTRHIRVLGPFLLFDYNNTKMKSIDVVHPNTGLYIRCLQKS